MSRLWRAFWVGSFLFWASGAFAVTPQAALDRFAKNLGYRFTLLSNKATDACPDNPVQQYCFSATLDLTMPKIMPMGDWSLYLAFAEHVLPLNSDTFTLTR